MSAPRAFDPIPEIGVAYGDLTVLASRVLAILGVNQTGAVDLEQIYKHTLQGAAWDIEQIAKQMEEEHEVKWSGILLRIAATLECAGDMADVLAKMHAYQPFNSEEPGEAANGC